MKPFLLQKRGSKWIVVLDMDAARSFGARGRMARGKVWADRTGRYVVVATPGGLDLAPEEGAKPKTFTKSDAESVAHKVGRYMLDLGDFAYTYVAVEAAEKKEVERDEPRRDWKNDDRGHRRASLLAWDRRRHKRRRVRPRRGRDPDGKLFLVRIPYPRTAMRPGRETVTVIVRAAGLEDARRWAAANYGERRAAISVYRGERSETAWTDRIREVRAGYEDAMRRGRFSSERVIHGRKRDASSRSARRATSRARARRSMIRAEDRWETAKIHASASESSVRERRRAREAWQRARRRHRMLSRDYSPSHPAPGDHVRFKASHGVDTYVVTDARGRFVRIRSLRTGAEGTASPSELWLVSRGHARRERDRSRSRRRRSS